MAVDKQIFFAAPKQPEEDFEESSTWNVINATTFNNVEEYVETLQSRARQLRLEATNLERALRESQSSQGKVQRSAGQTLHDRIFDQYSVAATPEAISQVLQQERWSVDQATLVLELLYEQRKQYSPNMPQASKPRVFQIGDTSNAAPVFNETQVVMVDQKVQALLAAADLMDNALAMDASATSGSRWSGRGLQTLKSKWSELQRTDEKELKRLTRTSLYRVLSARNESSSLQDYMRATLGLTSKSDNPKSLNMSRVMERVKMIPPWLPSPLLPYIAAANAIVSKEDVKLLKEKVLPGSGFFVTSSDSIPSAALFRGNIRVPMMADPRNFRNVSASVFEAIHLRLEMEEGLADRVQLFLLEDQSPGEKEAKAKPVLLVLSKKVEPDDRLLKQQSPLLRQAAVTLTLVTTFVYSVKCFALNPQFFNAIMQQNDARVLFCCLPTILGVLALQAIGEGVRWLVARRRKMKIGPPMPIPSTQVGTFGCATPLRSFPKNRSTMIEIAMASPITIFLLSSALIVVGTILTVRSSETALASFPFLPVAVLKSSFLVGAILTYLAPKVILMPLAQPIPMHPAFVIGFAGLVASSLNMLPIFRLDGGRACTAALGNRVGAIASVSSLMFLLSVSLSSETGLGMAWCVIIAIFRRNFEVPARDEITRVDDTRLGAWIAGLVGALLVLLPFPGGTSVL
ncbi:hypothetical protein MPSEU_000301700 [Mayamaea pseudoterrestris]|nr:hypothetical protein MPSEU_000301700 [Mayamaea pseudoterrestris]